MAAHLDRSILPPVSRISASLSALFALWPVLGAASLAGAAPPAYVARASIVQVERSYVNRTTAVVPGAGIRVFQDPEIENNGAERFDIRWYANPPGIPPGAILLLESLQDRDALVKNRILRTTAKSEGHIRSVIEIPPDEIQRAGRVVKWRVRIVWRGRALATQASDNWDG
ncbi:MAG TPA: hypothetical protein DCM68_06120 [Verrucomicrobia bacterium]|nr:hypothetical protein [Verrucomicrobiota bacterium]